METQKEEINLLNNLWSDVNSFLDNLDETDSDSLKKTLEQIMKSIKGITKEALIRNLKRTDDPKFNFSGQNNIRVETKNFYPSILTWSETVEKRLIWKATKWKVFKTIKDLEKLLEKKVTEENYRNEILKQQNYSDVLELLNIRCVKIENQILNFENSNKIFESNRIWLLLYILWFENNHKLKVYGNDTEVYIYDEILNKTFICGNNKDYKTYIATGKKDLYDIWEFSKNDVEKNFIIVNFYSSQQWESEIKHIISPKKDLKSTQSTQTELQQTNHKVTVEAPIEQSHLEIAKEETPNQILLEVEKIDKDIEQTVPTKEEPTQNDTLTEQTENQNPEKADIIKSEFKEFYSNWKFDYNSFVDLMETKHWIKLPNKLSSLNSIFGRNPYIFSADYTIAILSWDKEKYRNIEKQMRDKWYNESKLPYSEEIRNSFKQYFELKTEEEKKEFKEKNIELFKNLRRKAEKLWWLPIAKEEYIQTLIEENRAKSFVVAEREYVTKVVRCFPYSKGVSDIIKEYKRQWWENENLTKYMESLAMWENKTIVDGKNILTPNKNWQRDILFTRRSIASIWKEDIRVIFKNSETWEFEVSKENYEIFLKENPEAQKLFQKTIYDLIPYFKDEDKYANNMIHSITYLQALLEWDINKANQERQLYMKKKIEESKKPDIQEMLMLVWRYLERYGDKSISGWTMRAKPEEIDRIMSKNPNLKKRLLNKGTSIVSYCIMDINQNFNNIDYASLRNILSPKIKEIQAISPAIYNKEFKI